MALNQSCKADFATHQPYSLLARIADPLSLSAVKLNVYIDAQHNSTESFKCGITVFRNSRERSKLKLLSLMIILMADNY
jgi:hypothetical protein